MKFANATIILGASLTLLQACKELRYQELTEFLCKYLTTGTVPSKRVMTKPTSQTIEWASSSVKHASSEIQYGPMMRFAMSPKMFDRIGTYRSAIESFFSSWLSNKVPQLSDDNRISLWLAVMDALLEMKAFDDYHNFLMKIEFLASVRTASPEAKEEIDVLLVLHSRRLDTYKPSSNVVRGYGEAIFKDISTAISYVKNEMETKQNS